MPDFSTTVPLDKLTASYFKKKWLRGLKICDESGEEPEDDYFEEKINDAILKIEALTGVDILQRKHVGETHDYHANDYLMYAFFQLHRMPAQEVSEVRAVYPAGQTIQVFPSNWVRLEKAHSQINLVPTAGSLGQIMIGRGFDYVVMAFCGVNYLPQLWEVDYISGFNPEKIPGEIVEAIMKYATIEVLQIASDTVVPIGQTSQSLSIDGLSQSRSYAMPAFQGRITAYKTDLGINDPSMTTGLIGQIRNNYRGIVLMSL